jgi:Anti-sigma factor NepR
MAGTLLRGIELQPDRSSSKGGKPATKDDKGKKGKDEAMGAALRSVYHATAAEPVPDQMLDLLRKLG